MLTVKELTNEDKIFLSELGFHNCAYYKSRWHKDTKTWDFEIGEGVIEVRHTFHSLSGRWFSAVVNDYKYPPWVRRDVAQLVEKGIIKVTPDIVK